MKTILLISANPETEPYPVYPIALAKLAAAVEAAGHRAVQFDPLVQGEADLPRVIRETAPDLIGLSLRNIDNVNADAPRSYFHHYQRLMAAIRRLSAAPVVLGGAGVSLFPHELLKSLEADAAVVGPGEVPLAALMARNLDPQQWSHIPGVLTKSSDQFFPAPSGPPPGASRHDPAIVQHYWQASGMIGLQTNRGCPQACSYCTYQMIDGPARLWSDPAAVVDEMVELKARYGVRYFFMTNSTFNTPSHRELLLAEEICRRSLTVSWGGYFAPANMNRDYLRLLQRSGLTHLEFGTDALCEAMLASYNKGFTVDEAVAVAHLCTELGLHQLHFLLLGGPGEDARTLAETLANTRRLKQVVICPFVGIRVYPGTKIYEAHRLECGWPAASLVRPDFYLAPGLTYDGVWQTVQEHRQAARNWIVPSRQPEAGPAMSFLRRQGVVGPCWEYLAS